MILDHSARRALGRGRLKVYLGFAAGVGKTYRMLEEAQALRHRGVDVVIGAIECHGRAATAALGTGLEGVPPRAFSYRGVTVQEMDMDAVVRRSPQVVIIDEVAHTNVPGSRNNKRHQDVIQILAAGISVICAFNVQHLESLNGLLARVTGVQVRETIPDTFLWQADQVVALDLDVEDLLERLRAGKIYPAEKVEWALGSFFQPRTLATLRELALREVAESLERSMNAPRSPAAAASADTEQGGKLMVCLSSNPPHARTLLRRGSRLAGRLNTDWYVVYVEVPSEAPERSDEATHRHLGQNIDLARELGAEVVRLRGADPVALLFEFARSHRVSDIVIGRTRDSIVRRIVGRSVTAKMVAQAEGFDLHIVSFAEPRGGMPAGLEEPP